MKLLLSAILAATALLTAAPPAQACPTGSDAAACAPLSAEVAESRAETKRRAPPRIIFGESAGATFEFRELRVPRRTGAVNRQAYFGSGAGYDETLAELQAQLQRMTARSRLEGLALSPAQEAARNEMPPALVRALSLSQQAREDDGAGN